MIRILGSIFLLLTTTLLYAGSIEAHVDMDEVSPKDSIILTITVVGEDIKSLPDIDTVGGAKVLNSSRRSGTNFTSINGKAKMEVMESLILEFVPEKSMTIPSFEVKVDGKIESSQPIPIKVSRDKKRVVSSENFALDMELSKSKIFVGEPIIATVRFRQKRDIRVLDIEYQQPKFQGFFSKVIGKQRNYNKGAYSYMELRYLLIAKQEGNISVEPAHAKVAQSSGDRRFGGIFSSSPKWSRLISASPTVEVLKVEGEYDVVGDYKIRDSVDTQEVKANKPVNLKIELKGEGSLDDFEGVVFDIDGVTIYSDDAKVESKLAGKTLQSHYLKQFVFISDHDFTIPSKTIRAYDYKTGKIKIFKTKEYNIKVVGGSTTSTTPAVYTKNRVDTPTTKEQSSSTVSWMMPSWFMLLGAFILGVVATIVGQRYFDSFSFGKFRPQFSISRDEALEILYPKMGESAEVEEMVRRLYDAKQGKKVHIDKEELKRLVERYSA